MRLRLILAIAMLAAAFVPALAAAAPGRVVLPISGPSVEDIKYMSAPSYHPVSAVALPDGAIAALLGGFAVVQIRSDGSLNTAFGRAGFASVGVGRSFVNGRRLLRQPDGRLLVAGDIFSADGAHSGVVRLTATGQIDESFGRGGLATGPLASAQDITLQPDGSMLVSGSVGARDDERWAVARLTADGASDQSFAGGVVGLPIQGGFASRAVAVAAAPPGRIFALGHDDKLGRLLIAVTPDGAIDAAFGAGAPVRVPGASGILPRPDAAIDVLPSLTSSTAGAAGGSRITRLTATGAIDSSFAAGGHLALGGLGAIAAPDASILAVKLRESGVTLLRIEDERTLAGPTEHALRFGRGSAGSFGSRDAPREGLSLPVAVPRYDGSVVVIGGVNLSQYRSGNQAVLSQFLGLAAFTPSLQPDASFGAPPHAAVARLRILTRSAQFAVRAGRVRVRVTASAPGLARLRARDARGRILALTRIAIHKAGTVNVSLALTPIGRRVLRRGSHAVRFDYHFRDVLAARDAGTAHARLR